MRKARILLILGTWVAVLPYLGLPYSWKNILFTITGLGLIYFSYVLFRNSKKKKNFDNFRENYDFEKNQNSNETKQTESPGEDYSAG